MQLLIRFMFCDLLNDTTSIIFIFFVFVINIKSYRFVAIHIQNEKKSRKYLLRKHYIGVCEAAIYMNIFFFFILAVYGNRSIRFDINNDNNKKTKIIEVV